jgi:hypothetical protein
LSFPKKGESLWVKAEAEKVATVAISKQTKKVTTVVTPELLRA